jgi:hypothetical protein
MNEERRTGFWLRATKLPNSKQSYKGKVKSMKTNKISQQPENCENRNDPDLVQAEIH